MHENVKAIGRSIDGYARWALSRVNDGVVPFRVGRFVNSRDRPALTARTFYEVQQLTTILDENDVHPESILEIGSGYGRLSPWLAERCDRYAGVEPNDGGRERAKELLPSLKFYDERAQSLPFDDDSFELVVSWTVLQHIPPTELPDAVSEIERVLMPEGQMLLAEKTHGENTAIVHPRSPSTYENEFDRLTLKDYQERVLEPEEPDNCHVMLFKHSG